MGTIVKAMPIREEHLNGMGYSEKTIAFVAAVFAAARRYFCKMVRLPQQLNGND